MEELLRLTKENNVMLKRICMWLDKVESPQHREHEDMREFLQNVVANILTERVVNNPINRESNTQQTFWR